MADRAKPDRSPGAAPTTVHRPKKSPGRPQDQRLDAAILGAALKLVAEVGYERVSIEEVARRASTAKTSVYRRWPTKDAMVLAAVRFYMRERSGSTRPNAAADSGSLRDDLLAHARRLAAGLTRERVSVFAGLLLAMRTNPALADGVRGQLIEAEVGVVRLLLQRAIRRGELSGDRPVALLTMLLPSVLFTRLLVLDAPLDDEFLTRLVDQVLVPAFRNA